MGLMKELNDLNAIYLKMHEQQVSEDQDKGYVVTRADKKGNTPAWQGYKAGKKNVKTGKPLYRAADHLKNEEAEVEVDEGYGKIKTPEKLVAKVRQPKKGAAPKGSKMREEVEVDESIGSAIDKGLSAGADVAKVAGKAAVGGVKVASKVAKKTAGAAGRVAGTVIGVAKSAKKGFKGGAAADEEVKIDAMDHYLNELKKVTLASYAKKATKSVQITPVFEQIVFKDDRQPESKKTIANQRKIRLGVAQDSIYGKKLKFRITSRKSGRKVDLNVSFVHTHKKPERD